MTNKEDQPLREYIGFIWIDDKPGIRLRLMARSLTEARALVVKQYGEGHLIYFWNEEDASKPR